MSLPAHVPAEIADAAFDSENYRQIMGVLARRLQERVRRAEILDSGLLRWLARLPYGIRAASARAQAAVQLSRLPVPVPTLGWHALLCALLCVFLTSSFALFCAHPPLRLCPGRELAHVLQGAAAAGAPAQARARQDCGGRAGGALGGVGGLLVCGWSAAAVCGCAGWCCCGCTHHAQRLPGRPLV